MTPSNTPRTHQLDLRSLVLRAVGATLASLLALSALPAAAQPPSSISCDTDVSNLVAAVTGSSGNGGNPNTIFFVDATTGQTTSIAPTTVVPNHLAYDSEKQLLYYVDHSGQALYAYDVNSGATTLIDADIRSIPGTGDMPAGFTGHDAGTFWNNRYYVIPHDGTTGQTGSDLHWIEFDATGLAIADSGLLPMTLPAGISDMGDFGDIVIDLNGRLFGSSTSAAGGQLAGLFTADMNLAVPVVSVLNPSYTGAQLALSGSDELYGNDWQTGQIVHLDKTTGAILSTVPIDFGGDFFDMAPISPNECDWGDLADPPYATLKASSGPAHKTGVVTNVFLGAAVDSEADGQPSADGSGDGPEDDGVRFLNPTLPGGVIDIEVEASDAGVLNAWIDFNSDGDFADAGEQIASDLVVAAGTNTLDNVPVPATATGVTASRFRITVASGQGGDLPTGSADNGEVEDYVLACLGGTAWNDLDGDGIQDGGSEVGVSGVTVHLLSPVFPFLPLVDGAGTPVTTTTDGAGDYEFCGLPTVSSSGLPDPGQYRVLFDRPAAFADFSPANQGGNDALDSDADQDPFGTGFEGLAPLDSLPPITLAANQNDSTIDAGMRAVTAALVTSAGAYVDGGAVVFEFSTGYEALTAGFEVMRYDPEAQDYVAVSETRIPALLGAPQGGVYRVVDETAPFAPELRYVIVEHQTDGRNQAYGPYAVAVEHRGARSPLVDGNAAKAHVSDRLTERLTLAARHNEAERGTSTKRRLTAVGDPKTSVALNIEIGDSGVYYLSAEDLAAVAGTRAEEVSSLIRGRRVAMELRGNSVSWLAGSNGAGLFFYGEALDSLYSLHNVYRLHLGRKGSIMEGGSGLTGGSAPIGFREVSTSFTSVEVFERDLLPAINSTLESEIDHWYWTGINAASADTTRSFDLEVPDAVVGSAVLRARFAGATNGPGHLDHHATVRLNGAEIGSARWSGMDRHTLEMPFDGALLTPTTTVEVEASLAGSESIFFIDGFELEYRRASLALDNRLAYVAGPGSEATIGRFDSDRVLVLDLTSPTRPRLVESRTQPEDRGYAVSFATGGAGTLYATTTESAALRPAGVRRGHGSRDLKAAHHRYEHLVIAPEAWRAEAENMAAYRSGQGMRSLAVSLEEVYDTFSHGISTPWAVRDFLAHAHAHWSQAPDLVVLAGRGTLDPRDLLGHGDNHLPVPLVGTSYGLVPSDNPLADLDGDSAPDVAIGRLPIVSGDELAQYLEKLERSEASAGDWRGRALLLADNGDGAGNFPAQSNRVRAVLSGYRSQSFDLADYTTAEARAALLAAWNEGAALVNYVGHGGVTQAAAEGLLRVSDMDALVNGERLPIVSALTCVVGRSDIPGLESLAEALVTDPDGGAIAVWAPAGVSLSGAAHELNLLYAAALERSEPGTTLGAVVLQTMRAFHRGGGVLELLDTYAVAGDPAVPFL